MRLALWLSLMWFVAHAQAELEVGLIDIENRTILNLFKSNWHDISRLSTYEPAQFAPISVHGWPPT